MEIVWPAINEFAPDDASVVSDAEIERDESPVTATPSIVTVTVAVPDEDLLVKLLIVPPTGALSTMLYVVFRGRSIIPDTLMSQS